MNAHLTSIFNKIICGSLFFFTFSTTQAQTVSSTQDSAIITFLGTKDDMVIFSVACPNPSGDKFSIIIKDQDGSQLYQQTFKEKDFHKQFRLPRTDKDQITFIIRNYRQADLTRTFQVQVNSRVVKDVAVKKMDL